MPPSAPEMRAAEVVLPCEQLDETLAFFTDRPGFRVAAVSPADDPRAVVIAGHGLRLRLHVGEAGNPACSGCFAGTLHAAAHIVVAGAIIMPIIGWLLSAVVHLATRKKG